MLKLELDYKTSDILPEILKIMDAMVELYNSDSKELYLKIHSDIKGSDVTVRYETFSSKEQLLTVLQNNCPKGYKLSFS